MRFTSSPPSQQKASDALLALVTPFSSASIFALLFSFSLVMASALV